MHRYTTVLFKLTSSLTAASQLHHNLSARLLRRFMQVYNAAKDGHAAVKLVCDCLSIKFARVNFSVLCFLYNITERD